MSVFPALMPSGRSYVPPTVPVSTFTSISGKETRVILGDTAVGHQLTLSFNNIQEPAANQIFDHYRGQAGVALAFELAPEVYAGWTSYTSEVGATQKWRYGGPPEVEFVAPGIMSLSVNLVGLA